MHYALVLYNTSILLYPNPRLIYSIKTFNGKLLNHTRGKGMIK